MRTTNNTYKRIHTILLAGGKGTRMKKTLPKILNPIAGKPILFWTLDLLDEIRIKNCTVVTSYKSKYVKKEIQKAGYEVLFATQRKPMGTAHAVKVGLKTLSKDIKDVFVLYGDDSALYKPKTIQKFIRAHQLSRKKLSLLVLESSMPSQLGGLERNKAGKVVGVLTMQDMIEKGIKKPLILCGALCFNRKWLDENIVKVKKGTLSGEYPLPSLITIAANQKKYANVFYLNSELEWNSVNTPKELEEAKKKKANKK